jgi:hypothetical protein
LLRQSKGAMCDARRVDGTAKKCRRANASGLWFCERAAVPPVLGALRRRRARLVERPCGGREPLAASPYPETRAGEGHAIRQVGILRDGDVGGAGVDVTGAGTGFFRAVRRFWIPVPTAHDTIRVPATAAHDATALLERRSNGRSRRRGSGAAASGLFLFERPAGLLRAQLRRPLFPDHDIRQSVQVRKLQQLLSCSRDQGGLWQQNR